MSSQAALIRRRLDDRPAEETPPMKLLRYGPKGHERPGLLQMTQLIESGAARIAAGIHRVGANFDFEVLSLPGGSVIAALLWLYASTMGTPKRTRPQYRVLDEVSTIHANKVLRDAHA
jgi:hypothetical protein